MRKFLLSVGLITGLVLPARGELGLGVSSVFLPDEGRVAPGFHLHLIKEFIIPIGIGVSFEHIRDRDRHNVLSLTLLYRVNEAVSVSYMLGTSLEDKSAVNHLELTFNVFESYFYHVGIFAGVSFSKENHFSLGVHLGF